LYEKWVFIDFTEIITARKQKESPLSHNWTTSLRRHDDLHLKIANQQSNLPILTPMGGATSIDDENAPRGLTATRKARIDPACRPSRAEKPSHEQFCNLENAMAHPFHSGSEKSIAHP